MSAVEIINDANECFCYANDYMYFKSLYYGGKQKSSLAVGKSIWLFKILVYFSPLFFNRQPKTNNGNMTFSSFLEQLKLIKKYI